MKVVLWPALEYPSTQEPPPLHKINDLHPKSFYKLQIAKRIFLGMSVFPACVYMPAHVFRSHWTSKEGVGAPGTELQMAVKGLVGT